MFLDPKSAVLICLVGILFGVVILHVCLLLSEKSENLFSFEGQLTVRQQCSKATPTPAGSGKRARRTRRKKLWNHQKRAVIYESNEHHTTPEIQLEYPCQRCKKTNAKRSCSYQCCATCCNWAKNMCHGHGTEQLVAVSLVESARNHQLISFDLSYAHLKRCPPGITEIGNQLTSLNLSNNQLSSLPVEIGRLTNLEEFFLQYNCLSCLPDSICSLRRLLELDVKNNALDSLPDAIGNLKRLQVLNLTNNHISHIPNTIGRLRQLEEFSVHSNNLHELPDQICHASKLRVIYAGENSFKRLPKDIGCLVKLEELDVSGCALECLPESLSNCRSLERLWLTNNRLWTLPLHIGRLCKLKELHVRNNAIKYFPSSIQKLQLYTFTAQNNNFIQENAAKSLMKTPSHLIPPLLELAARAVVKMQVPFGHGSIPNHLEVMLGSCKQCSLCGQHLFHHCSTRITYRTIGFYYKVPLYDTFCISCHLLSS